MLGDQGNIRAIRVIRGENGLQDWPQRGAEGTKAEAGGLTAHRRSSTLISNRGRVPTENTEGGLGFLASVRRQVLTLDYSWQSHATGKGYSPASLEVLGNDSGGKNCGSDR